MSERTPIEARVDDSGYEPFRMFEGPEEGGEVNWVVNDETGQRFFGFYRNDRPLPEGNSYKVTLDEYLHVIEGGIEISFLPDGPVLSFGPGDAGFLPAGSEVSVMLTELPYKESLVLVEPGDPAA
jgi:ethanolamine utilization protein EutQ (cupin superfamily)